MNMIDDIDFPNVLRMLVTGTAAHRLSLAISSIDNCVSNAMFSMIVRSGIDVNDGKLLQKAAKASDFRFLKVLLANGVSIDAKMSRSRSFLHLAAVMGSVELIKFLLDHGGINVNAVDDKGKTPLHVICRCRLDVACRISIVSLLIAAGANTAAVDKKGRTPLHVALTVDRDHTASVVKALITAKSDVNAIDNDGVSVVEQCLRLGIYHSDSLRMLIDAGANVLRPLANGGSICPFVTRLYDGHRLLCMLVDEGADINAVDCNGDTPCHIYARHTWRYANDVLKVLIRLRAKADVANKIGETPLSLLLSASHVTTRAIAAFLDLGANVNSTSATGQTVCHLAAQLCDLTFMQELMKKQRFKMSSFRVSPNNLMPLSRARARRSRTIRHESDIER
jgi:ankyrin repeat protein